MKSTKFSIVIPTYNSAKTILPTLDSLSAQDWKNFEVIVVDGQSSDNTLKIIESYSSLKCKVFSEKDSGIYDAVNKGISLSGGDLICVLGSDDQLAAGALRAVHDCWKQEGGDIVAGKALLVKKDGSSELRVDEVYGQGALVSGIPFCHNAMFVTRAAYRKVGDYSLEYKICADAHWVHRSIIAGCHCSRLDLVLVHFSLDGTSSNNDELVMAETYSMIRSNFPTISLHESEVIFKAVRGWTGPEFVYDILVKHSESAQLKASVELALQALHSKSFIGCNIQPHGRKVRSKILSIISSALTKLSVIIKN